MNYKKLSDDELELKARSLQRMRDEGFEQFMTAAKELDEVNAVMYNRVMKRETADQ